MYHTTGFTRDEIDELCARVHAANEAADESEKITRPPILGLFTSVVVTLTYLRRNRIQAEIGECYGVSQSTVSRAVTALTRYWARRWRGMCRWPRTSTRGRSTSWMAPCCPAGHGPRTPNCTPACTKELA